MSQADATMIRPDREIVAFLFHFKG